ncbi:hypothetical protein [Algoriphagus yeomjeoni]|uniref:Uncharacterized protein n=1 Tax=Algoriphagus yeomjeoni TaxID=291403 RepID=A0A327PEW3_9BACT|nr:hypothetical protein [Algoriphagus yeomjeoni]RAI89987.1 hypothetical protein LV83_01989 [Algoriphagus yeomjeoni]
MKRLYKILGILFLFAYSAALYDYYRKNKDASVERYRILDDSSELEMSDFLSFQEIWTGMDAEVSVGLVLQKNETLEVKAFIDRHQSWYRAGLVSSEELFTHESYHVKLAKSMAKELNKKIKTNNYGESKIHSELSRYRKRLSFLQKKYDFESNHSLNEVMQIYWECKIDSMLNQEESYELFNNVSAFFPEKPKANYLLYDHDTFLGYTVKKKKIEFIIWNLNEVYLDTLMLENWSVDFLFNQGLTNIIINWTPNHPNAILENHSEDSINMMTFKDKLLLDSVNQLYYARFSYPANPLSDSIYQKMGNQFFNSIKIDSK